MAAAALEELQHKATPAGAHQVADALEAEHVSSGWTSPVFAAEQQRVNFVAKAVSVAQEVARSLQAVLV